VTELEVLRIRYNNARDTIAELKQELSVLYSKVAYYESIKGTGDVRQHYGGTATSTVGQGQLK
jgi:hypothetical protein